MNRRQFIVNALRGLVILGVGKGVYNTTSPSLVIEEQTVHIPDLPSSFKGFRIAQLSDIHSSFIVSSGLIREAVKGVMERRPDMICLTGDFISGETKFLSGSIGGFNEKYLHKCLESLAGLSAPMGIYGVLGNHDFWSGEKAVKSITEAFTEKLGVRWLRNSNQKIQKGGKHICIMGIDDYWQPSSSIYSALKGSADDEIRILLSHNPDINQEIEIGKIKIDLVISGHTHGGQFVFPFIGAPYIPSAFGRKYIAGLVRDGKRQTYISRGVGHLLFPIRVNCPPEATILNLI